MISSQKEILLRRVVLDGMEHLSFGISHLNNKQPKMRNYLFFTTQGYTYDPNNKEITNMQILGSEEGEDILEAFKNFKTSHSYLT